MGAVGAHAAHHRGVLAGAGVRDGAVGGAGATLGDPLGVSYVANKYKIKIDSHEKMSTPVVTSIVT